MPRARRKLSRLAPIIDVAHLSGVIIQTCGHNRGFPLLRNGFVKPDIDESCSRPVLRPIQLQKFCRLISLTAFDHDSVEDRTVVICPSENRLKCAGYGEGDLLRKSSYYCLFCEDGSREIDLAEALTCPDSDCRFKFGFYIRSVIIN